MAAHISYLSAAEVPETVPLQAPADVPRIIRVHRRWADPKVPVDVIRHRLDFRKITTSFGQPAAPDSGFFHGSNCAVLNQFDHTSVIVRGVYLCAHLRCEPAFIFEVCLADHPGLFYGIG